MTKVIVSPFADEQAFADTKALIRNAGHTFPVEQSSLTAGSTLLPTEAELKRFLQGPFA